MLDFRQFRQFSKILSSKQKFSDREWTEMIADDHVLNVEMPRFPNLFNISIFWHGANANRSSLLNSLHSYRFINPVSKQKSQIAEKINHWDANYQADWMHENIKFFDFSLISPRAMLTQFSFLFYISSRFYKACKSYVILYLWKNIDGTNLLYETIHVNR